MIYGQQQLPFMQQGYQLAPDGGTYGQTGGNMRPDGNGGWGNSYQPQMNPNQQLAAQNGMGSRAFYSPFNSPYGGQRQGGPDYARMQQSGMGMGPNAKAGGGPYDQPWMPQQGYSRPGMDAQLAQPAPQMNPYGNTNPYTPGGVTDQVNAMQRAQGQPFNPQSAQALYNQYQGLNGGAGGEDLIRQMQGTDNGAGFNAAMRQGGNMLSGGPGGQYSYQGGYQAALPPPPQTSQWSSQQGVPFVPMNSFAQQNRTRGMSGGMFNGRPQRAPGTATILGAPPPSTPGGIY